MFSQLSDEELMRLYCEGDIPAFDELYRRYENRLFSFLRRRVSDNEAIALDVFQLTWLKVHTARESFDRTLRFSSWIFTIAVNTLRDEMGEAWKRYRQEIDENEIYANSESESPLEIIEREEVREKIESALQKISIPQREAILLSDLEGFSSKEIASIMGLSDGSVRQLIFRARRELSVILGREGVEFK